MGELSIALICTVISTLITFCSFQYQKRKNRDSDITDDTRRQIQYQEEIRHILSGITDIKYDSRNLANAISQINERVIRSEEQIKRNRHDVEELRNIIKEGR